MLTAECGSSDRMLVDVVGPYVLPDASAEADSVVSGWLSSLSLLGAGHLVGGVPDRPERSAVDPHPMRDHRQPTRHCAWARTLPRRRATSTPLRFSQRGPTA